MYSSYILVSGAGSISSSSVRVRLAVTDVLAAVKSSSDGSSNSTDSSSQIASKFNALVTSTVRERVAEASSESPLSFEESQTIQVMVNAVADVVKTVRLKASALTAWVNLLQGVGKKDDGVKAAVLGLVNNW